MTYALIAHPTEPRVLLLAGADGWGPLALTTDEEGDVRAAIASVREQLAVETTALLRFPIAWQQIQPGDDEGDQVVALEPHTWEWQPPSHARWIDRAELVGLELARPDLRSPLEAWLASVERVMPAQRVAWARVGWYDEAAAWMRAEAERLGTPITGAVEQVKTSFWACILRAETAHGALYFKASAPAFGYETALTEALAVRFPAYVPPVLAADLDRRWLLLADGGVSLRPAVRETRDPSLMEAALRRFAELQRATAAQTETLLATGCPDRRLAALPAQFDALVADRDALLLGLPGGVPEAEYVRMRGFAPEMREMCARLAGYGIPETLHHDDFGAGNVLVGADDVYRFFDWGESAVTHPFCSLMIALRWARYLLDYDAATLDRLRDAYLAAWTERAPLAKLREAFALAHRVGYLCRALTYYEATAGIEPLLRGEYADAPGYWLRLFVNDAEPDEE
jgi:hypothetical protein